VGDPAVYGFKDFTAFEAELRARVAARSWTSGDGPKAIFGDAAGWLRERDVLLPGVSTLTRLVEVPRRHDPAPVVSTGGAVDGGSAVRAGPAGAIRELRDPDAPDDEDEA
jgi:Domain of unknown function (DUF4158)